MKLTDLKTYQPPKQNNPIDIKIAQYLNKEIYDIELISYMMNEIKDLRLRVKDLVNEKVRNEINSNR